MESMPVRPNQFLRHWLMHALSVWPTAFVACIFIWVPVTIIVTVVGHLTGLYNVAQFLAFLLIITLPGAAIGYCIGHLQSSLMVGELRWASPRWVDLTALGGILGSLLILATSTVFADVISSDLRLMLVMPVFMLAVSGMQWLELRHMARESWLWVLGNVVGGVVFSGLMFVNHPDLYHLYYPALLMVLWLMAAGAQGLITGIVMLWLYDRRQDDWEYDPKLARVPVEVYTRDLHNRR